MSPDRNCPDKAVIFPPLHIRPISVFPSIHSFSFIYVLYLFILFYLLFHSLILFFPILIPHTVFPCLLPWFPSPSFWPFSHWLPDTVFTPILSPLTHWSDHLSDLSDLLLYRSPLLHMWLTHHPGDGSSKLCSVNFYQTTSHISQKQSASRKGKSSSQ
jgi:hypothetical protein